MSQKNKKTGFITRLLLGSALAFGTAQAMADNCYIMVHGHGTNGTIKSGTNQPALDYWSSYNFSEYAGNSAITELISGSSDNYAVVGYNSTDEAGYPWWRDETAGEIARQIISIRQGNGDGYIHPEANTQCAANDTFWVVSHSQGATEMMYIAGNALPGSPNYNTAYTASSGVSVDFNAAISGIAGIFTLGGAITGTEGADRVCNGNWLDSLINAAFLGQDCNQSVAWLQTFDSYAVKNYIGSNLAAPVYVMGGYKGFPGFEGASSALIEGEDDGYINLASQMSCAGSGKRHLESDLNDYNYFLGIQYGSPIFRCNDSNKGTPRTYNMASVYTDHDAERNAGIKYPSYTNIEDGITCGNGRSMAGRINSCL
jgi:hypothetical protein